MGTYTDLSTGGKLTVFRLQLPGHLVTRADLRVVHQEQVTVVADPLEHLPTATVYAVLK